MLGGLRGHLRLELFTLRFQVDSEQSRRKAREKPHDEAGPHKIADRVRHRDIVQQPLFLGVWQIKPRNRITRRADDSALCEGTSHEARRSAAVVLEHLRRRNCHHEARHTQDQRQHHLRHRVSLEPSEKLRTHLVTGREKEKVEKHDFNERMNLDGQLANEHAREQRAHDISELERPNPHTPKHESERERQEDCKLGIVSQRRDNVRNHAFLAFDIADSSRCGM